MALLTVTLADGIVYRQLVMGNARDAGTWAAKTIAGGGQSLAKAEYAAMFFQDIERSLGVAVGSVFVSVAQNDAGQHIFVNMGQAQTALLAGGAQLALLAEDEVKAAGDSGRVSLLYAREADEAVAPAETEGPDLCKHGWATNYSVVPEVSLGRTQKLILCDEATLCRVLPDERIFEYLKVIINCHENSCSMAKYKVGSCGTDAKPEVVCQAVHGWFSGGKDNMNRVNDEMQEKIWEGLQTGSVAVHCLAGIHRAACIVACHFLWRHYHLGHTDVSAEPADIYRKLQAVRPHVSPAYAHVLQSYEAHLKAKVAGAGR